jgi:glycosyltransferase involved in cell wall biosynthesis
LLRALESLNALDFPHDAFEVVIVDNNSSDDTRQTAESARLKTGLNIKYVMEERLSFTVARHAGANTASGDILLYIDDDVTVTQGWMRAIVDAFDSNTKVGMAGGAIDPIFEAIPPPWVYQMDSIWLSLFNYGDKTREIFGVPGPNLCIRSSVLKEVGGFPPDTIGVEAEGRAGTFEKIYIGPGDWGLSQKVKAAGYKILYVAGAGVYHHIPPVRLSKGWWYARLSGEGCYLAITYQHDHQNSSFKLLLRSLYSLGLATKEMVYRSIASLIRKYKEPHDFQVAFYLSRAKIEFLLARYPNLADCLWEIGLKGIKPGEDIGVLRLLI